MSAAEAARRTLHTQGGSADVGCSAERRPGVSSRWRSCTETSSGPRSPSWRSVGDAAVFSTEEGTAHDRSGGLLRLSQRRAAVGFDEAGVLTVCKPVTQPAGAHLPEIISELLESDLTGCLRFASAVYHEVDQQRRARRGSARRNAHWSGPLHLAHALGVSGVPEQREHCHVLGQGDCR